MAKSMARRITKPTSGVIRPKTARPVTPKAGGVNRRVTAQKPIGVPTVPKMTRKEKV